MIVPKMREPNARVARRRTIDNLWREVEQKKAELQGAVSPTLFRNPKFYFGVIAVLVLVGGALFNATDSAARRQQESPGLRTLRHLDVLAEALGRYRFHVGSFPTEEQGLAALVRDPLAPKWDGPYINLLRKDPWETPFVYKPGGAALPVLLSCGPDRTPGTADDLLPDPARFDPGTEWTNGWVSAEKRLIGVTILPSAPARRAK
jgi:general secretion pathway protein G